MVSEKQLLDFLLKRMVPMRIVNPKLRDVSIQMPGEPRHVVGRPLMEYLRKLGYLVNANSYYERRDRRCTFHCTLHGNHYPHATTLLYDVYGSKLESMYTRDGKVQLGSRSLFHVGDITILRSLEKKYTGNLNDAERRVVREHQDGEDKDRP